MTEGTSSAQLFSAQVLTKGSKEDKPPHHEKIISYVVLFLTERVWLQCHATQHYAS